MVELAPGSGVYLHQEQYHLALMRCSTPSRRVLKPQGKYSKSGAKDGRPAARYLLRIFFSAEEIARGSLSETTEHFNTLNKTITDAIKGFGQIKKDSGTSGHMSSKQSIASREAEVHSSRPNHPVTSSPLTLSTRNVRERMADTGSKPAQTVKQIAGSVFYFEHWLWTKTGVHERIEEIPPELLDQHLAEFYPVLKKTNGENYDAQRLGKLRSYIDRFLRELNYPFSISKSTAFNQSQTVYAQLRKGLINPCTMPEENPDDFHSYVDFTNPSNIYI